MKKQKYLNLIPLVFIIIFCYPFESCDNELYLDFPTPDDKIVIDGWIESGSKASVLLTANSPYFSNIDSASLRNLVLTRAKVTLSDGYVTEILTLRRNDNYFPPYIYESNDIKGKVGETYYLKVEYGGKTVSAYTTIPKPVNLDTVYYKFVEGSDSLVEVYITFTDPPGEKNYYRIFTQRIGVDKKYYSTFIMALDDKHFNGKQFGFSILRGSKTYLSAKENNYYKVGDTLNIKFCTIDKEHYEFWMSFREEVLNTGNPFASSLSDINSNVTGDGLGIWGGYSVSLYQLLIK